LERNDRRSKSSERITTRLLPSVIVLAPFAEYVGSAEACHRDASLISKPGERADR